MGTTVERIIHTTCDKCGIKVSNCAKDLGRGPFRGPLDPTKHIPGWTIFEASQTRLGNTVQPGEEGWLAEKVNFARAYFCPKCAAELDKIAESTAEAFLGAEKWKEEKAKTIRDQESFAAAGVDEDPFVGLGIPAGLGYLAGRGCFPPGRLRAGPGCQTDHHGLKAAMAETLTEQAQIKAKIAANQPVEVMPDIHYVPVSDPP